MKNIKLYIFIIIMSAVNISNGYLIAANDLTEHTRSNITALDTIPPVVPQGVVSYSYEYHADIVWKPNSESDLAGYKIYKKVGGSYVFYTVIPKEQEYLTEYFGSLGVSSSYKVSAYDMDGNESPASDSVDVLTRTITDDEFLTMVQRATFRYFWDYAHPVSGLTRERFGSNNTVTIGGSGFGVMAILVGIERGFITRAKGAERLLKILNFLSSQADRFHGAFPHWMNGETGSVVPFSQFDDGGDLVETSFMIQGLLTAREYFDKTDSSEVQIRNLITSIWESVEWTWYQRASFSDYLYWHWSPNFGWQINIKLVGWNETMIAYLLGIASPTFGVPSKLYYNGWASSSNYVNGNTYFGYKLWVGQSYGGPLFFAHYSFLGFDPRFKRDAFTNYFNNNRNHTLINRAYCISNPKSFAGYDENNWGLTASDDPWGYLAHAPYGTDNGTITPTAAISSMPYTPQESIEALKNFYRSYGNNIWGEYGFKDAFNIQENWFANSYLAIDQGPIIVMIENYRSQLLWNNFMANPEIQTMIDSIGFVPDTVTSVSHLDNQVNLFKVSGNYPNPFNPSTKIQFTIPGTMNVELDIYDILGSKVKTLINEEISAGEYELLWDGTNSASNAVPSGIYIYTIKAGDQIFNGKMVLQK